MLRRLFATLAPLGLAGCVNVSYVPQEIPHTMVGTPMGASNSETSNETFWKSRFGWCVATETVSALPARATTEQVADALDADPTARTQLANFRTGYNVDCGEQNAVTKAMLAKNVPPQNQLSRQAIRKLPLPNLPVYAAVTKANLGTRFNVGAGTTCTGTLYLVEPAAGQKVAGATGRVPEFGNFQVPAGKVAPYGSFYYNGAVIASGLSCATTQILVQPRFQ